MRKFLILLFLIAFACNTKTISNKPLITVSILPQKYFVEKIAGDLVDVNVLVPPGASPEMYSLMASQMTDLARSEVWFRIGKIGFEESWVDKISQTNPELKIVDTSVGIDWIDGEGEELGQNMKDIEEDTHSHGVDPHIWLSPKEVRLVVEQIYKTLTDLFPEHKDELTVNYHLFLNEINELDEYLGTQFQNLKNRTFFIFHPALTYLARQYNLRQVALEVEGKEPSPRYLQQVIELAEAERIKVIFIQKEFDEENASQLAKEIEGEVVQIDPLNEDWENQLREIAQKITNASNK